MSKYVCRDCGRRSKTWYWTNVNGKKLTCPRCPECHEDALRKSVAASKTEYFLVRTR